MFSQKPILQNSILFRLVKFKLTKFTFEHGICNYLNEINYKRKIIKEIRWNLFIRLHIIEIFYKTIIY